jgi:hypothetical protein
MWLLIHDTDNWNDCIIMELYDGNLEQIKRAVEERIKSFVKDVEIENLADGNFVWRSDYESFYLKQFNPVTL